MIQLIRRYYLTCIFLCAPFLTNAQLLKADSLFDARSYYAASIAYERALFQNEQPTFSNQLLLKKTYCLKALERYEDGYKNLLRADLYSNTDSLNFALRYELIINAYLAEAYDIADNHLKQLNHFVESDVLRMKVAFLEILSLNEMMKWDEAKAKLISYNDKQKTNFNVDSLYNFLDNPKIRNIKKTVGIATVAPGLIQIREGKPLDGLLSAAIRGSLIYFVIDQFGKHYFLSGSFSGAALYFIFYQGAVKHALDLTNKRNRNKIKKYNHRVRHALISYEMSIINDNFNNNH